ncbi:hypothetical protein J132_11224 [Termitomyces sp. J132]|nr:hypothetical protein J132_11224 [Termitomyces sp. J132]
MFFRTSSVLILMACLVDLAPVKGAPTLFTIRQEETTNATTQSTGSFQKQNALDAQKLNAQLNALKESDSCTDGAIACINTSFAQCIQAKWVLSECPSGLRCVALPLVNKPGTTLACDTDTDANSRFETAGVQGGISGNGPITGNKTTTTVTSSADDDCEDGATNAHNQGDDCEDEDGTASESGTDEVEDCEDNSTAETTTSVSSTSVTTNGTEIPCTPVPSTSTVTVTTIVTPAATASTTASSASYSSSLGVPSFATNANFKLPLRLPPPLL